MFDTLICVFIGMLIGWHIPEPPWAKALKQKLLTLYTSTKKDV